MAINNSPGHGGSTAVQTEDWVTPVNAHKGTEDGPEVIMPKESLWYRYYVAIFLMYDVDSPMAKKICLRFWIPFPSYLELVEQIKADDRFDRWCGFKKFEQATSPIELLVLGFLRYLSHGC
jgi:hypothetical protein